MDKTATFGYYAGSRWFSGGVSLGLIAIFALWLLHALLDAEELAEKTTVEMTVRNMQTGLRVAMGEAIVAGRENEIGSWIGTNPVSWLGGAPKGVPVMRLMSATASNEVGMPPGYLGECTSDQTKALPEAAWCFDRERRELAYRPRRQQYLHLLPEVPEGKAILRWRVSAVAGTTQQTPVFAGIKIETVTPYRWAPE